MSKILFLTNVIRRMGMMERTMQDLQNEQKLGALCRCIWTDEKAAWDERWEKDISGSDLLIMKWMSADLDCPFFKKLLAYVRQNHIPYYFDVAGTAEKELFDGLKDEESITIKKYSMFGGEENYSNLWLYADSLITKSGATIPAPDPVHWSGIFRPGAKKAYTDLASYKADFCDPSKPTVGIFFYRDEWVWNDLTYQTALIREAEKQGLNVICAFSNGMPVEEMGMPSLTQVFKNLFCEGELPGIDVLINTMKFSLTSGGSMTIDYLKKFNVPILEAYTILAPYEEWASSLEGMNAMEVSISLALPEFDGIIHGVPIASKKVLENGDVRYYPINERIERIIGKAKKWAALRRKENSDKKIAIVFHNYPPKNSNIGSAVGLDTIESVRLLLKRMKERGYKVDFIPEDGKSFIDILTANATNDRSMLTDKQIKEACKITGSAYQKFFDMAEESSRLQLTKDWGGAPGAVMEYDGDLLVPGTMNGNVFITVQPPRGFGEDPSKIYHDPFVAPTHHYLAFYYWIRDIWQADAVAHIGTHGSLEWLPGKNAGLGATCFPDLALGDLPNIYPYLITITGEGIQAKRRGAACLVEHLPAPQTRAGLYDELEELEKIMDEYAYFEHTQPENLDKLEDLVKAKVVQANLQDEVIRDEMKPFSEYIAKLHNYITDLKNMQTHTGLHILGRPPQEQGLIEYLRLLTRLDVGGVPGLNDVLAGYYGFDYAGLLETSGAIFAPLNITHGQLIDKIEDKAKEIIAVLYDNNFTDKALKSLEGNEWIQNGSEEFKEKLFKICKYICQTIYPNLLLTEQEMENVLRGFEGQYIEPGPSGAPSSGGADLLPTGRNFYGVDPRGLPTPAAWELGKILGDQAISRYIEEEGRYPESVGIVLWSGANMRSRGQCVAEFLYLMGIKPVWQSGSLRVSSLEVMPIAELKRPRIDVTARISGLFRDTMPSVTELLDKAVLLAADLDEDEETNFVRKHIKADSEELEQGGMNKADAWRQAAFRIFGDKQGVYGAGVAALLETKNWETIDDIADVYIRWGAHAYGGKVKGEFLPQIFRKRLSTLDITIKNEDNHETSMLSSDDYNAYHGGMIAAVRSIKGSAPRSYCGDSSDRSRPEMHSVQEEAKRVFRSEAINPKFIEGMMKHGYKGAADMANYIAHSFQWDVTSAVMEDWMYEKYAEKYAFDPKVQNWMREVNPWALKRAVEILMEAQRRGLWNAKEETMEELQKIYLDMEGELEDRVDMNG